MPVPTITRANVDALLDSGLLKIQTRHSRWWTIRRNGVTKQWKRDTERVCIPIKFGLKHCDQITETAFLPTGEINPAYFRHKPEA